MALPPTTRVVRGGRALETIYWHVNTGGGGVRLVKHGKTLKFPKKMVPREPSVAEQAFKKLNSRL